MQDPQPTPTRATPSRVDALRALMTGVEAGLPAPKNIRFQDGSVYVDFDSAAHINVWATALGLNGDGVYVGRNCQPHPLDVPPHQYEEWLTSVWRDDWQGWRLSVKADDPITDEQRREWVESGQAAQRAEYLAKKAGEQA